MKLRIAPVALVLIVCLPALCQDPKQIEKELNRDYKGKSATLRNAYSGTPLRYNGAGELWDGGPAAPWTMTGRVRIKKISLKKDKLEIQADRLLIVYDDKKRDFYEHSSWQKVKIEVAPAAGQPSAEDWKKTVEKVFVQSEEEWWATLPAQWRGFFEGRKQIHTTSNLLQPGEKNLSEEGVCRIGGSVSAPKCISCPDPDYNELARSKRVEGIAVVWAVIDAEGRVDHIRIAKPLGAGLDEAALDALKRWRFEPARRDGKAVPVQFTVEINFHLY